MPDRYPDLSVKYSITSGEDACGKYVQHRPPYVDNALQGLQTQIDKFQRMYLDELDLTIVKNMSDEQLGSIITAANAELNRRQNDTT